MTLEEAMISIWRQAMLEDAKFVELDGKRHRVTKSSHRRLREVTFVFDGRELKGLEQNPDTASRWAKLAREGSKVMQFLEGSRYIANVVDGKVMSYSKRESKS
jgi:hypothetical protein